MSLTSARQRFEQTGPKWPPSQTQSNPVQFIHKSRDSVGWTSGCLMNNKTVIIQEQESYLWVRSSKSEHQSKIEVSSIISQIGYCF